MSESEVQKYVIDRLELLSRNEPVYFFRSNSFSGQITRANGSTGFIKNNKKGLPDLVACIKGFFVGIECKSEKGQQSQEQKLAQMSIEGCNGLYWLIRSPEELESKLKTIL